MKKLLFSIMCVFAVLSISFAQTSAPNAFEAKQLEQITTACKTAGLTDEQIAKAKTIITDCWKKNAEVKADATLDAEAKKTKLKENNDMKDWKIQNLMKDKYKAYVEARKKLAVEAKAASKE